MRLQWALLLGALVGAHAQGVIKRQDDSDETSSGAPPASSSEPPTSSSSSAEESTSSQPPASSSSSAGGDDDEDTTVFRTVTVTNDDVETVNRVTTVFSTSTTTVFVTSTEVKKSTVTEDGDVSTSTEWVTVTSTVQKRSLAVRTLDAEDREVPAPAPFTTVPSDWYAPRAAQDPHLLGKRATITQLTTVTEDSDGGATTVFSTAVRRVVSTVTDETTITTTIIETARPNAKSTSTVTSTLTITSTAKGSGGVSTSDPEPTGGSGDNGDNNSGGNSDSSKDKGLSTGAKAGIGAGAGIAGLAIIGVLAWFFLRRRRDPKPDHDDLIGASEVPVGGPVGSSGHSGPSTAHHNAAAAFLAPGRTQTKASHSPEGYRGTALGDGRSGFAKPSPYGSAYAPASSTSPTTAYSQPTDYDYSGHTERGSTMVSSNSPDGLPEHPSPQSAAAEIDSRPAVAQHGGPVYEMPGQPYR
jgi:hypothetical protein